MSKRQRAYEMAVQRIDRPFTSAWFCRDCGETAVVEFDPNFADLETAAAELAQAQAEHHEQHCPDCAAIHGAAYLVPLVPACVKDRDCDDLWLTELARPHLESWDPTHA